MSTGIDTIRFRQQVPSTSKEGEHLLLKKTKEQSKNFASHSVITTEPNRRSIFNFEDTIAETDFARLNRSKWEVYKSGAKSVAESLITQFNVTTPIFDFVNYCKQPSDKTEAAIKDIFDKRVSDLASAKPEQLERLSKLDIADYIKQTNGLTLGQESLYSAEIAEEPFTNMLKAICKGLSTPQNQQDFKENANDIIFKLNDMDMPVEMSDLPPEFFSGKYPPTPDTILLRHHFRVKDSNNVNNNLLVDSLMHDFLQMHDFYLSMSAASVEAKSLQLEGLINKITNAESKQSLCGAISDALGKVTELADRNGALIYMTILFTALVERNVATPSKMAELASVLAPFLSDSNTTEPANLQSLLNNTQAMHDIENIFTVDKTDNVASKPANLGASSFAAMLYFIGTAQNAAERTKSANLQGPSTELLQHTFEKLKEGLSNMEDSEWTNLLRTDEFINKVTTNVDKVVNKVGVGASYLRAMLNVGFEFKPALPNIASLDFAFSMANRGFVPSLMLESEGMKHDGIVQNEKNMIKLARLKALSNQPLTDRENDILAYDRDAPSEYAKSRFKSNCTLFAMTGVVSAITLIDMVATLANSYGILEQKALDPDSASNTLPVWKTAVPGTEDWFQPIDLLFGFKLLPTAAAGFAMAETDWWSAGYNRYDMEHVGYCFARNFFGIAPALLWEIGKTSIDTAANLVDTLIVTYSQDKGAADSKRKSNLCRKLELLKVTVQAQAYMELNKAHSPGNSEEASAPLGNLSHENENKKVEAATTSNDSPPAYSELNNSALEKSQSVPEATQQKEKDTTPTSIADFYSQYTSQLKNKLELMEIVQRAQDAAKNFNPRKAMSPEQNYHADLVLAEQACIESIV